MGELEGVVLPTLVDTADHTYVRCGTLGKAWGCWGRKSGGRVIASGSGSTKRSDRIARPDERANIKCYLVNGVCHQSANRILLPARRLVRGARGYGISHALYGTYGRTAFWPCRGPFARFAGVTGDLPECVRGKRRRRPRRISEADKLDWQYIESELILYRQASRLFTGREHDARSHLSFQLRLFRNMMEFNLGPMLDRELSRKLIAIRRATEGRRLRLERAFGADALSAGEFVSEYDSVTLGFQEDMAGALNTRQYHALFDLERDERVTLSDPRVVRRVYVD